MRQSADIYGKSRQSLPAGSDNLLQYKKFSKNPCVCQLAEAFEEMLAFCDFAVFGVFTTFAFIESMNFNHKVIGEEIAIPTIGYNFLCDKYWRSYGQ